MKNSQHPKIEKIKAYFIEHKDFAQLIKFCIASFLAFLIEYASFTIIVLALKNNNQDFAWFLFKYTQADGGQGAFIAFLVSTILAQIAAFIINRKKTFNATNNLIFSASAYAVMVCGIVILNTWAGGAITRGCSNVIPNTTICQYIGKLCGSFFAFVITFFMSKFVIMKSETDRTS